MRKVLPALVATAAVIGVLTGTGTTSSVAATASASTSPPAVKILSAGAAPRRTLLLHVPDGTAAQATMEMTESIEQKLSGQTINSADTPPFRIGMKVTSGTASANGVLPIAYGYSDVSVVDNGSVTPAQLSQYQAALQPLTALTGTAKLTPRNQVLDSKVAGTEHLNASLGQVVTQLTDQLGSLSTPFPKEAVGVGARWRTTAALHVSGIDATQVTEYTLRAVDGDQVTLDAEVTQTAPRQRADLPGVAAGTKVTLTKWRTLGSGQVTTSLVIPGLPVASDLHSTGTQTFLVTMGAQHGTLDQKIAIDVKVSQ